MTRVLAGAGAPRRVVPAIEKRAEDRWLTSPVVNRVSLAMYGVVLASLLLHAGLLLFATFGEVPSTTRPEITVELVQEPAPEPKPAAKGSQTPAPKMDAPGSEAPKAEAPKLDEAKPEPSNQEAEKAPEAKAEPPKPDPVQPEPPKADAPKPDLRQTQAEPHEAKTVPEAKSEPPAEDKLAEHANAVDQLKEELDSLKAERAALAAEQRQVAQSESPETPVAQPPSMLAEPKIGGIPASFAAVALPGLSEIDGIATGYQELVFSQLAKAKGIRRHMGMPGTAGVVFSVDASGKLVKASIAQPSGSDALDKEALEIVNAAGPFPKPPPGSERTFAANFSFVPQAAP